jgi:hypothetical protein
MEKFTTRCVTSSLARMHAAAVPRLSGYGSGVVGVDSSDADGPRKGSGTVAGPAEVWQLASGRPGVEGRPCQWAVGAVVGRGT